MGPAGGDGFNLRVGSEIASLRQLEAGRHLLCGQVCAEGKVCRGRWGGGWSGSPLRGILKGEQILRQKRNKVGVVPKGLGQGL